MLLSELASPSCSIDDMRQTAHAQADHETPVTMIGGTRFDLPRLSRRNSNNRAMTATTNKYVDLATIGSSQAPRGSTIALYSDQSQAHVQ